MNILMTDGHLTWSVDAWTSAYRGPGTGRVAYSHTTCVRRRGGEWEVFFFFMVLTRLVGVPALPALSRHGPICFPCYPNASGPPLPAFVPSRLEYHQI